MVWSLTVCQSISTAVRDVQPLKQSLLIVVTFDKPVSVVNDEQFLNASPFKVVTPDNPVILDKFVQFAKQFPGILRVFEDTFIDAMRVHPMKSRSSLSLVPNKNYTLVKLLLVSLLQFSNDLYANVISPESPDIVSRLLQSLNAHVPIFSRLLLAVTVFNAVHPQNTGTYAHACPCPIIVRLLISISSRAVQSLKL